MVSSRFPLIKIGIFSNLYPPQARGGAELIASRVADELYNRGHKVFVLTTRPFACFSSCRPEVTELQLGSVYRFFPVNFYHLTNDFAKPFLLKLLWHAIDAVQPCTAHLIKKLIAQESPDVILTHNLKGFGLIAGRTIQKTNTKHIHTIHDVQLSTPSGLLMYRDENSWLNRSLVRRLYECVSKWAVGKPDIVISPSKFLMDFYLARGFFSSSDRRILPNPASEMDSLTRTLVPSAPIRLLFVGQLEAHKGVPLLFRAIEKMKEPIELHIAGEGSLTAFVVEQSKKDSRVNYHGFVSLDHLARLLAVADVTLVPSLCYENSPTVIYESFVAGVPVIASKSGGIPELIDDGRTGFLCEPGNEESFIQAIQTFIARRAEFWSRASEIKQEAEKYSLKKYVDALEEMMKSK